MTVLDKDAIRRLIQIHGHRVVLAELQELVAELRQEELARVKALKAEQSSQGRKKGSHITISRTFGTRVSIGRVVYEALGQPPRIDIQKSGRFIRFIPIFRGNDGFKVSGGGLRGYHITAKSADDLLPADGQYWPTVTATNATIEL